MNVCGRHTPRWAPPGTIGSHTGAKIMASAATSRLATTTASGKPTNHRMSRNAWARQKSAVNRARNDAQKPPPRRGAAGGWTTTSSSDRASTASTAAKPLTITVSPIRSGITSGVMNRPMHRHHTVTSATNQASPSGMPESR